MMRIQRLVAIVFLSGTIAGCASEMAKPVSLDVALRGVEEDKKGASGVSPHDVLRRASVQEYEVKREKLPATIF